MNPNPEEKDDYKKKKETKFKSFIPSENYNEICKRVPKHIRKNYPMEKWEEAMKEEKEAYSSAQN